MSCKAPFCRKLCTSSTARLLLKNDSSMWSSRLHTQPTQTGLI